MMKSFDNSSEKINTVNIPYSYQIYNNFDTKYYKNFFH